MFTLLESRRRSGRTIGGTATSVLIHAALITCAVYVTAQAKEMPTYDPPEKPIPLFPPSEPAPETHTPHPSRTGAGAPGPTTVPRLPLPPIEIPDSLPAIDSTPDPSRGAFPDSARAAEPGVGGSGARGSGDGAPWIASQVDRPAMARTGNPSPRYPAMLERSGVEGEVVAQFVVDTTGRAEMATFEILKASNALFAAALRDAVARWRFLPAEAGGRRVRQLVEVPVRFVAPPPG